MTRKLVGFMLCCILLLMSISTAWAQPLEPLPMELTAPAVILVEAGTGQVLFEKDADTLRPVASVTKIMTLLLVFDAVDSGALSLDTEITISKAAAGMGGSQALLDAGSVYLAGELIKAVVVGSANDAAVALAEQLNGTEANFVEKMNQRANDMGMKNTNFANCTGLPAPGAGSSARDVAIMSRALLLKEHYYDYSTIWVDTIEHKGGRKSDLTNTNRMIRSYDGCDGVKTGSTNEAGFCVSNSALRGDMRLIAVVLGATSSKVRFAEATQMLNWGFSNYHIARIANMGDIAAKDVPLRKSGSDTINLVYGADVSLLLKKGEERELEMYPEIPEEVAAPLARGAQVGQIQVKRGAEEIAVIPIVVPNDVELPGYGQALRRVILQWFFR